MRYRALLDADAVARWKVPNGMTGRVHRFEVREGGSFKVSLRRIRDAGAPRYR